MNLSGIFGWKNDAHNLSNLQFLQNQRSREPFHLVYHRHKFLLLLQRGVIPACNRYYCIPQTVLSVGTRCKYLPGGFQETLQLPVAPAPELPVLVRRALLQLLALEIVSVTLILRSGGWFFGKSQSLLCYAPFAKIAGVQGVQGIEDGRTRKFLCRILSCLLVRSLESLYYRGGSARISIKSLITHLW